jgi:hypothetical protein
MDIDFMTDYFGGQSRDELEILLRRLITQGAEGPKVDFKAMLDLDNKSAHAELAKDISSIANTDDETRFDDFGYIIIGAERGRILGTKEFDGDVDKLQARVTDVLKGYVGPLPQFSIAAFNESGVGAWGAIIVPPSARQPHVLTRDGSTGVIKHEWWVRVNDTKERASPQDYARMIAKAIRREVRPLELELQRLSLRMEQHGTSNFETLAQMLKGFVGRDTEQNSTRVVDPEWDLASSVRNLLVRGEAAVESALITEALRVAEVMVETSECNPWVFSGRKGEQLRAILSYLEERSFPLAYALATIARHDQQGVLTNAVCRVLQIIAKEPRPKGTHYPRIGEFRLYPLVLCLYALVTICANEERADLLNRVMSLRLEREERDEVEPLFGAFRRIRYATDVFNAALEQEYFEPVSMRVREEFMPRLSSLLMGRPSSDAFYVAEFVVALGYLTVSEQIEGAKIPLPGNYLYEYGAHRPLRRFLRQRPVWLGEALGQPLETVLENFDQTVEKTINRMGRGDGFTSGAAEAYQGKPS